jgi:prepilin-type N-terminal cleavage/methylation domain-containing protein
MNSKRAFTLVELLVVIAIIGILAALLMPALNKAQSQAGKATDLNNLRQIMIAVHSYAADGRDVLPSANWDAGGGSLPGWLYTPGGPTNFDRTTGQLWPVLHGPKLYVCPDDNPQMRRWWVTVTPTSTATRPPGWRRCSPATAPSGNRTKRIRSISMMVQITRPKASADAMLRAACKRLSTARSATSN